jgi:metallo-beta-lactamase family protein
MLQYEGLGGVDGRTAGSKHLFTLKTKDGVEKLLHDCGSNMSENSNDMTEFKDYPGLVNGLSVISLGHGHFDHAGDLHKPHQRGYKGRYFGQKATVDLVESQLRGIVEQEYFNNKRACDAVRGKRDSNGNYIPFPKPSFTSVDAKAIMANFARVNYDERIQISKNIAVTYREAGHIIGSSQAVYEFNDNGVVKRVVMAVDLGRDDMDIPLLRQPFENFSESIDHCFIESTYGDRPHTDRETTRAVLEEVIQRGIKENKKMLMASFAIMRTQWILSDLFDIYKSGKLPSDFRIYFDSPTALDVNKVILKNPDCLDERAIEELLNKKENPFKFPNLVYVGNKQKSMALDNLPGPHLVISASGMWFMGRIKSHAKSRVPDPNALLIGTGYQCKGCLGYLIEEGKEKHPKLTIDGQDYDYKADYVRLRGYSAHADGNQCVRHVVNCVKPKKRAFVVHGEKEQSEWTLKQLQARGQDAEIVRRNKVYEL